MYALMNTSATSPHAAAATSHGSSLVVSSSPSQPPTQQQQQQQQEARTAHPFSWKTKRMKADMWSALPAELSASYTHMLQFRLCPSSVCCHSGFSFSHPNVSLSSLTPLRVVIPEHLLPHTKRFNLQVRCQNVANDGGAVVASAVAHNSVPAYSDMHLEWSVVTTAPHSGSTTSSPSSSSAARHHHNNIVVASSSAAACGIIGSSGLAGLRQFVVHMTRARTFALSTTITHCSSSKSFCSLYFGLSLPPVAPTFASSCNCLAKETCCLPL